MAAALRQAGLIDSDDGESDAAPSAPPAATAPSAAAPSEPPCDPEAPSPHCRGADSPGTEADDVIEDTDDEALFAAAEVAEREVLAHDQHPAATPRPLCTPTPSTQHPPHHSAAATPASAGFVTALELASTGIFGAPHPTVAVTHAHHACTPGQPPTVGPSASTPTAQGGSAVPAPAAVACTPSSWGPSPWTAPESVGIPGVVRYEVADDYDTERTGSTLNTQDPEVSPALSTPHGPSLLPGPSCMPGGRPSAATAGAARPVAPVATANQPGSEAGAGAATGAMPETSPAALDVSQGTACGRDADRGARAPVVKLPSLKAAMKRSPASAGSAAVEAGLAGTPDASAPVVSPDVPGCPRPNAPCPVTSALASADSQEHAEGHGGSAQESVAGAASPPELRRTGRVFAEAPAGDSVPPRVDLSAERAVGEGAQGGGPPHRGGGGTLSLPRVGRGPRSAAVSADAPDTGATPADSPGVPSAAAAVQLTALGRVERSVCGAGVFVVAAGLCGGEAGTDDELPGAPADGVGALSDSGRVILHVDVDSFYCQVPVPPAAR